MAGIYLHIPFCKQACSYCNFYFLTRDQLRQPFVDALVQEIEHYQDSSFSRQEIRTVYFGGGTPSLLTSGQLNQILTALYRVFTIQSEETTIEMNPDDVSKSYLKELKDLGFSRISMGVQSFDPELLEFMNRAHTKDEAERALEIIREINFPSYTADLIYGNPGQSLQALERDIDHLLNFSPPHISAYSLTIESGTRLGKQVELGRVQPVEDEAVEAHFDLVREKLKQAGLQRYEVSNFAKPGREAIHNSNYWKHVNYLGLGPSAHSLLWNENGARRWRNQPDIKLYLEKQWEELQDEVENLSLKTLAEERLMLGLRTVAGVSTAKLVNRYGYELNTQQWDWLELQQDRNCVHIIKSEYGHSTLLLTEEGLKIADYIVLELISKGNS